MFWKYVVNWTVVKYNHVFCYRYLNIYHFLPSIYQIACMQRWTEIHYVVFMWKLKRFNHARHFVNSKKIFSFFLFSSRSWHIWCSNSLEKIERNWFCSGFDGNESIRQSWLRKSNEGIIEYAIVFLNKQFEDMVIHRICLSVGLALCLKSTSLWRTGLLSEIGSRSDDMAALQYAGDLPGSRKVLFG